jgi:tripartite-type tricarboxylate transporter receptor subunit TctC
MLRFQTALVAAVFLIGSGTAPAQQTWPVKPVRLIVANAAGAAVDTGARIIASALSGPLGQAVNVENRPGAEGYLAAQVVARAEPDGHTLFFASQSIFAIDPHIKKNFPFDLERDFTPIVVLVDDTGPVGLFTHPSMPFTTLQEMVSYHRTNPGKLSIAISVPQFSMLASWIDKRAGIETLQVPYKSAAQAVQDIVAGRVSLFLTNFGFFERYVKAGKVRPLLVTRPAQDWPQIPTLASIFPDFTYTTFFSLVGPGGMPRELVQQINRTVAAVVEDPKFNQSLTKIRWRNLNGARTPEGTAEFQTRTRAQWGQFISDIGLRPQ